MRSLLLFLMLGTSMAYGQKRYTLEGELVNAATQQPLARAEVSLSLDGRSAASPSVYTDAAGRFRIDGLPEGEYLVGIGRPDFGKLMYGEYPDAATGTRVAVGPKLSGIQRLAIPPFSTVRGIVRDEAGDPMDGARVTLYTRDHRLGKPYYSAVREVRTDDLGAFEVSNMRPGIYYACATVEDGRTPMTPVKLDLAAPRSTMRYPSFCHPAEQGRNVVPLAFAFGQDAQLELTLVPERVYSVRGRFVGLPESASPQIRVRATGLEEESRFGVQMEIDAERQTFTIVNLPPGSYELEFSAGGATESHAFTSVSVASSDVDGVQANLIADAAVTFRALDGRVPVGSRVALIPLDRPAAYD